MPSPSDLLQWSAIHIGAAAAVVTGLGILYRLLITPAFRKVAAAFRIVHRVTVAADRLIPFAEMQLRPNGGSSLADQVSRIESSVRGVEDRLTTIETRLQKGDDHAAV